jgi:uncharacterized protein with HEPN domain
MPRDDRVYLKHIGDAITRINEFIAGASEGEFRRRRMMQSAVVRELEIVGEATRNLSEEFLQAHGEIEWAAIMAMRNRLIHAYFDVDLNVVWEVVHEDLPTLARLVNGVVGE